MTNTRIYLPNWYQLDFDIASAKVTLHKIVKLTEILATKGLIGKWFYLFEITTIRVRFYSKKGIILDKTTQEEAKKLGLTIPKEHPFEQYWEMSDSLENETIIKTFAEIMSVLTILTITRLKGAKFSNFKLTERLSHCIFNNVYGSDTERYFLLKRLDASFDDADNPEQTLLDEIKNYMWGCTFSGKFSAINIPIKKLPSKK